MTLYIVEVEMDGEWVPLTMTCTGTKESAEGQRINRERQWPDTKFRVGKYISTDEADARFNEVMKCIAHGGSEPE